MRPVLLAGTLSLSGATLDGTAIAGVDQGLDAFCIVDASHLGLLDPIFNGTSWATSISGSGTTLVISDVFGATGVITLNCK